MSPSKPRGASRRARRFLPLAEKAIIYNAYMDEGMKRYPPKPWLYTERCAEAYRFFQAHPELRQEPQQAPQ
jgi:hypothetical protein